LAPVIRPVGSVIDALPVAPLAGPGLPAGEWLRPRPVSSTGSSAPVVPGGAGAAPTAPGATQPGTIMPPPLGSEVTRLPGRLGVERLENLGHGGLAPGPAAGGWASGGPLSSFLNSLAGLGGVTPVSGFSAAETGSVSGSGSSNAPPPPLPAPSGGSGSSSGSGVAFSTLFALLVSLAAFSAQRFSRRLTLALAPWRPAAFIAVIERPG
jgi:hypothetical protein